MFYKKLWDVAVRIGVTSVGCTVVVDIVNELMGCCGTVRRKFWKGCAFFWGGCLSGFCPPSLSFQSYCAVCYSVVSLILWMWREEELGQMFSLRLCFSTASFCVCVCVCVYLCETTLQLSHNNS